MTGHETPVERPTFDELTLAVQIVAHDVYTPEGVAAMWATRHRHLDGRSPQQAEDARDYAAMETLLRWIDSYAEGVPG